MLMILARLVRSESFWAVAKVRSPHTGPEFGYPRGGSRVEVGRDQARRGEISLEGRTRPGQPRLGRSHCTRLERCDYGMTAD